VEGIIREGDRDRDLAGYLRITSSALLRDLTNDLFNAMHRGCKFLPFRIIYQP
jgi:hypothetical protein